MSNLLTHKRLMRIAVEQAKRGVGRTHPNPLVGCAVVKNNRVIATGYHRRFGGPHAEIIALKKAGEAAKGATLYVTLEPCCHFGKTPPCTEAIIRSGIKEVVVAMVDPNPINNGRGLKLLRKNGIRITSGTLKKEAESLNKEFIERMSRYKPYITVKMAQSLDGKIATRTGDSRWISSGASRAMVHRLRSRHDAVMVGVNTIIKDNPMLSVRSLSHPVHFLHRHPVKIVADSRLRTPADAKIFSRYSPAKVIIATTKVAPEKKERMLIRKGAEVLRLENDSGRVDLKALLKKLSLRGIGSILVEGGGELTASLLENGYVDKLIFFIAPILIGGRDAVTSLEGEGIEKVKDAIRLEEVRINKVAGDLMVEGYVHRNN